MQRSLKVRLEAEYPVKGSELLPRDFSKYHKLERDEQLFMGNSAVFKVEGKGKVILKWTYGKELTLNDVLHLSLIHI